MSTLSPQRQESASTASEPIIDNITELCESCTWLVEVLMEGPKERPLSERRKAAELPLGRCPGTCRLCRMITEMPRRGSRKRVRMIDSYPEIGMCNNSPGDTHRICEASINEVNYSLWADEGTPACAVLTDRPPVLGPHMNQVCDLIQHWRKTCGAHENCVPEYDALLPTRILALCGDDARPLVKLIVSKGRKGRYLALSHCWGSSERPPLRTTSENFQSHQNGIPFGDMPKTFQDVVEIAQGIGIKYIWIDSICIIQGNSQDWHSEAAKMGDVYRNAALVVAASGAKDSSRGLFITDRPAETVFRLPYRVAGEIKGTFNMIPLSTVTDWHPEFGPLQRRAWTLQERHLARRFVSFMPGGISWICQTASITETGTPFRGFPSRREWFHLLSDYTGKSLTFPSDRIEAIRGIAQDIQSSRKDQYISKYGVWEEGLVDQLLWFKEEIYFEDGRSFNMPSWCWANTETRKRWPQESRDPFYTGLGKTIEMPKEIEIDSAGHLSITGHLNTTQPALGNVRYEFNSNRGGMFYDLCISSFMITDVYILSQDLASSYDKTVLGVGKFDNSGTTSYTHAWLLLKEPKIPEIQGATAELSTEEFCLNDVVYHTERNPEFAYWALLLEKVNESSYRRVGIAILFPTAYEALQVDVQEFTVV